ncbi:MAG: CPBP family intramembrane metalloprotease [Verrucomicrobia bacterium]|nr:CPBP family intramembrane metalloprotease [Verrucomicrobiota bacterium]
MNGDPESTPASPPPVPAPPILADLPSLALPPVRGLPPEPPVGAALGVTVLYVVLLVVLQMVFTVALMVLRKPPQLGSWMTAATLFMAFGLLLPLIPLLLGCPLRELFRLRLPGPIALAGGLLLCLGAWLWALEIGIVTERLLPMPEFIAKLFQELFSTADPVGSLVLLVLVPPVVEESLCRGIVLRAMLARWRPFWAVLASAVVFGAIHMNPWQFVYATWIGLVIGWAYARTRSLGLCLLMHAVNNGLSWLLIRWRPDLAIVSPDSPPPDHLPGVLLLGASGLLLAGAALISRTAAGAAPSGARPFPSGPTSNPGSAPVGPG